jgi:nitrate reductase gamma subunit
MDYTEFLNWTRGTGLQIALTVFIFGITLRFLEIYLLGRKKDYFVSRGSRFSGGIRTIFSRFGVKSSTLHLSAFVIIAGYVFHLGFFSVLLFLIPHIQLFKAAIGIEWIGLPTPIISAIAIMTMLAMLALLINRLTNPVLRFLSTGADFLVWTVTFLPLLTGYFTVYHLFLPYSLMLALHILSVEILLIVFPFTKLMHTFTAFLARWYTGANAAQRGVEL